VSHACGHTAQVRWVRSPVLGSATSGCSSVVRMFVGLRLCCAFTRCHAYCRPLARPRRLTNRSRCVPTYAETPITSNVKMAPTMSCVELRCVCAPTDRLEEFACSGPPVGALGVAEVRSDTSTLLRNPRLTAADKNSLLSWRSGCGDRPRGPLRPVRRRAVPRSAGGVRVTRASRCGVGHRTPIPRRVSRKSISAGREMSTWPRARHGQAQVGAAWCRLCQDCPEGARAFEDLAAAGALELLAQAPSRVCRGWCSEPIEGSVRSDRLLFVRPAS
jgi:hypothetical protein